MQTLSQSQLNQIERSLISIHHKRFFAIARYTGQKSIAILRLKTSDVYNEYRQPLAHIHFSGARKKTHKVIMFDSLRIALIRYAPEEFIYDNYLFPSRVNEGKHLNFNAIDKTLRAAVERTDLWHLKISTRSIRESFLETLYNQGIDFRIICKILGSVPEYRPLNHVELPPEKIAKLLENIFQV